MTSALQVTPLATPLQLGPDKYLQYVSGIGEARYWSILMNFSTIDCGLSV